MLAGVCIPLSGCHPTLRAATAVSVRQNEWHYGSARGVELHTEHYLVRTTCTDKDLLRRLPNFLEGCWSQYARIVPPRSAPASPALAFLFQTRAQWERFTLAFSPLRAPTYLKIRSGGFEERGVTVSHYGSMATLLSLMGHEGLHQFLSLTRNDVPPAWANEGLACYFEAFELTDSGAPVFTPRHNLIRRNNLRDAFVNRTLFDLREIVSTNAGRIVSLPSERVKTYYAQIWSIVLFLLEQDPARHPEAAGFRTLLADIGTDAMTARLAAAGARPEPTSSDYGAAVFRAYVSTDFDAFDRKYRAFVRDLLSLAD